jgi:hypothetical protein
LASHEIRADLLRGLTEDQLAKLVPAPVAHYIVEHGLYQ